MNKSRKGGIHLVPTPPEPASDPPRPLADAGLSLWNRLTSCYEFNDEAGREILWQACAGLDRAEGLAVEIRRDGPILQTRAGPKEHPGLRGELAARAFVVRTLSRLGLSYEPVRSTTGRPSPGVW